MVGTYTTNKDFYLPQTSGDAGTWGSLLNANTFPLIDTALGGYTAISVSSSNVVLSNSQDQTAILRINGTMSANIAVTSACLGFKIVENKTSGAFTLTVNTGIGTPLAIAQGGSSLVIMDATNGPRLGVNIGGTGSSSLTTGTFGLLMLATSTWNQGRALVSNSQSVTASSASLAIDMSLGWDVELTLSATVTSFTVSNWPASGIAGRLTLNISSTGAYNITGWPGTTYWAAGNKPTITSGNGSKDTIVITSNQGGTVFRGFLCSQAMS